MLPPLDAHHITAHFCSGEPTLDRWLKERALSSRANHTARTFVRCDGLNVVGFYAISMGAFDPAEATGKFRRNTPEIIPVALLARLAVDRTRQRQRYGCALFRDSVQRVLQASEFIGTHGMVVHAISEEAKAFYLALGFAASPIKGMTLMISLADLRRGFGA
ncbi:MAG: GNAT family N-acetyltransferase [Magnetococcales bacterium]|nr:GNAT family N-acetyltransferase [Magnetococcales bacterium]